MNAMKVAFAAVILLNSVLDVCLASEMGQETKASIMVSSVEASEDRSEGCCNNESSPPDSESENADSMCVYCANCHLWNYNLPVIFISPASLEKKIMSYDIKFSSPSLDGPRRPPKTLSQV